MRPKGRQPRPSHVRPCGDEFETGETMADEDDDALTGPEPIEVALPGDGPFQLPLCTDLATIAIGESLAILQFETMEGQRLDIPIPIGLLEEIRDAAEEARLAAVAGRDGPMVQ